MKSSLFLGVDVGGTKTHATAFDAHLNSLINYRVPTQTGSPGAVAASVLDTIGAVVEQLDGNAVDRIGIGIPGLIDQANGSVRQAVNLGIGSEPVRLVALIEDTFGVPCSIDNDVNVAALGAYHLLSKKQEISDLAYLSIGTGIAAGLILDGRLHRGHRGVAGEIGHFPIDPSGPVCECGLRGCLEAVASGSAIERAWPSEGGVDAAAALFAAAEAADAVAVATVKLISNSLARAVYMLAVSFDVDLLVIGGGVADLGEPLLAQIRLGIERLEANSDFVASLDLKQRITIGPGKALGAIGAGVLASAATTP